MKTIGFYIILLALFFSFMSFKDDGKYKLSQLGDTYVLHVKLDSVLYTKKCSCEYSKGKKCTLVRMNVIDVMHIADGAIWDKKQLIATKYLLVPFSKVEAILETHNQIITARNSVGQNYLAFTRVLGINKSEMELMTFQNTATYFVGYTECKKKRDVFEEYILNNSD